MKTLLRIAVNASALWLAANIVDGVTLSGNVFSWLIVAIIFGLVNALIRPIVRLLTLPLTVVTLGLFALVVNALMLMLTGWLSGFFGTGSLEVAGFFPALWASIIISIVSTILNWFVGD